MKTITDLQQMMDLVEINLLRVDMSRDHLRGVLGEPEMVCGQTSKYPVPTTWRYGMASFVFPAARDALEARGHGLLYAYLENEHGLVTDFLLGGNHIELVGSVREKKRGQ